MLDDVLFIVAGVHLGKQHDRVELFVRLRGAKRIVKEVRIWDENYCGGYGGGGILRKYGHKRISWRHQLVASLLVQSHLALALGFDVTLGLHLSQRNVAPESILPVVFRPVHDRVGVVCGIVGIQIPV